MKRLQKNVALTKIKIIQSDPLPELSNDEAQYYEQTLMLIRAFISIENSDARFLIIAFA